VPIIIYDNNAQKWKNLISPIKKADSNENRKQENTDRSEIAWRYSNMDIQLNELILSDEIPFLDLMKSV
jgi:hypothetical protein